MVVRNPHTTMAAASTRIRAWAALVTAWAFEGRPLQYLVLRYLFVCACGLTVCHHSPDAANDVIYARLRRATFHLDHN